MLLSDPTLLRQQAFIAGQWCTADSQGAAESARAIAAAQAALPEWREKTAAQRGQILRRWFELMLENQDDLALLMTLVSKANR